MTFETRRFGQARQDFFSVPVCHITYTVPAKSNAAAANFMNASTAKNQLWSPSHAAATVSTIPVTKSAFPMLIANLPSLRYPLQRHLVLLLDRRSNMGDLDTRSFWLPSLLSELAVPPRLGYNPFATI
jgi:hypothetical protein